MFVWLKISKLYFYALIMFFSSYHEGRIDNEIPQRFAFKRFRSYSLIVIKEFVHAYKQIPCTFCIVWVRHYLCWNCLLMVRVLYLACWLLKMCNMLQCWMLFMFIFNTEGFDVLLAFSLLYLYMIKHTLIKFGLFLIINVRLYIYSQSSPFYW